MRCGFEPGELVVVFVESQPIHTYTQQYRVIDAALGVVERGTWDVRDLAQQQPWLPDGPVRHRVTWTADGYEAAGEQTDAYLRAAEAREGTTPAAVKDVDG